FVSPLSGQKLAQHAYRLKPPVEENEVDSDTAVAQFSDRRRSDRYSLQIAIQVTGFDRLDGMWSDITETIDVSRYGVALKMRRALQFGAVVHLCLPLPDVLRSHGHLEPDYSVYAVVRRVVPSEDGSRKLGLEFIGEDAPPGFSDSPWGSFRLGNWDGPERRREPRADICEAVAVEYLSDDLKHVRQEVAVTENVSSSGARFFLKSAPPDVNLVRITNLDRTFESRATICNRFLGPDGFERLCVRFVDARWPM
ncbi:MAG TPA: PilZ domain-containing protein, partial [Blastocatellia bacterium]|nr:PilZ domain-containing protein [Blastocatellia bacterium]